MLRVVSGRNHRGTRLASLVLAFVAGAVGAVGTIVFAITVREHTAH